MSMSGWNVRGIGFTLFGHNNAKEVISFIAKHEDAVRKFWTAHTDQREELLEACKEYAAKEDFDDEEEAYDNIGLDMYGNDILWIVAGIINEVEGIHGVEGNPSCGETETEANILYVRSFPWEITEKEAAFKKEDVEELMMKYAEELGVDPSFVDEQDFEYYG